MTWQDTATRSFLVVALCVTHVPPVHAAQNAEGELRTGATSPEPWRLLFAPPVPSASSDEQDERVKPPTARQPAHAGWRLVCGMVVLDVDARLDPTMVVPMPSSAAGANISNMPVIKAECSDR